MVKYLYGFNRKNYLKNRLRRFSRDQIITRSPLTHLFHTRVSWISVPVQQREDGEYDHQIAYPVPKKRRAPVGQGFDAGDLLHVLGSALALVDGEQHVHGAHESLRYGAVERHLVSQVTTPGQFHQLKHENRSSFVLVEDIYAFRVPLI